jgi:hypothetical protein
MKRPRFEGPPSDAARARVAKLLAGEAPIVLDATEAAGSVAQSGNFYPKRKKPTVEPAKPPKTGR